MKQKIKRFVLFLCMITALVSLTACSQSTDTGTSVDPQLSAVYCPQFEQFLAQLSSYTDEELDQLAAQIENSSSMDAEEVNAYTNAFSSLKNVRGDLGAFVSPVSSELQAGDDRGEYICVVNAQYEKRTMEFKAFFTADQSSMKITGMSFSPSYTIGERMQKAALNTLMGLGTVFAVLIFISLIIYCFKFINPQQKSAQEKTAAPAPAAPAVSAPAASDEDEIIAVIAAAVAASEEEEDLAAAMTAAVIAYENEQNDSDDPLVARSFRRARRAKRKW